MIIFELSSLADDSHRRHLIDHKESWGSENPIRQHEIDSGKWQPDWQAYYDACDGDKPITQVMDMFFRLLEEEKYEIEIWSGTCHSVEKKIEVWLKDKLDYQFGTNPYFQWTYSLTMRSIGDDRPQEQLFEECIDELIKSEEGPFDPLGWTPVDMVFSCHKPTIEMFRKKGVFVFDCNQEI